MLWLLLALWLVGLGVIVWRRSVRSDGRSVEEFQHTLERLAPREPALQQHDGGRAAPPGEEVAAAAPARPLTPARGRPTPAQVPLSFAPKRRGPSRLPQLALAATAVVAVVAGVVWTTRDDAGVDTAAPTTTMPPAPSAPPTAGPVEPEPVEAPVALVQAEGDTWQYLVSRPGSTVSLVAGERCWLEVRSGASGPVLFEGVLEAGDRQELAIDGPVWLRIGNPPGVEVAVDGAVLGDLPAESVPINVDLQV
jgi:hypothetical protein